jgi:hypothetical protein
VISELGIDLDDAGFAGEVLSYGLYYRGGEGNPDEQERVIVDRRVRWATGDSGDPAKATNAVCSVLTSQLLDLDPVDCAAQRSADRNALGKQVSTWRQLPGTKSLPAIHRIRHVELDGNVHASRSAWRRARQRVRGA